MLKIPNKPPGQKPSAASSTVDLSRGARQFGILGRVQIPATILADYEEVDPAVGHNTAGIVLAVLSYRLAAGPIGSRDEFFTVSLRRKCDRKMVELDLALGRNWELGEECFRPYVIAEREVAL